MRRSVVALVAALVVSSAIAGFRWQKGFDATVAEAAPVDSVRRFADAVSAESLALAEEVIVANDPFRFSNTPPTVRFDPLGGSPRAQTSEPARSVSPRPVLTLKAIVGGPPWRAIIDGVPGQPTGVIAGSGERFDRLTVREVTRESVYVQTADTSWTLTFRRP